MINEKSTDSYKGFMLKAPTALATGHFSNQPPPPPPPQYKQGCVGTSIFSRDKDLQYEEVTSSVQMRMCSTSKVFHQ